MLSAVDDEDRQNIIWILAALLYTGVLQGFDFWIPALLLSRDGHKETFNSKCRSLLCSSLKMHYRNLSSRFLPGAEGRQLIIWILPLLLIRGAFQGSEF